MCRKARRGEQDGQALVVLVALVGVAVLVAISLSDVGNHVLARVRAQRAAEAAAEAAGAVVADRLLELNASPNVQAERRDAAGDVLDDPAVMAAARAAAGEVLVPLGAELQELRLERVIDEVAVRVEVRRDGVRARARVGVRPP
jgi:hypothetical protein